MAIPLTYAFNQLHLERLIELPGAEKIVFSICNLKNPESQETYLYLCAHAYDNNDLAITVEAQQTEEDDPFTDGATGCPTPPGWGPNVPPPPPDLVGLAPQFSVSVAELNGVLLKNKLFVGDVREVHVEIVGGLESEGLEAKLAIFGKDTDKSVISGILAESFVPVLVS